MTMGNYADGGDGTAQGRQKRFQVPSSQGRWVKQLQMGIYPRHPIEDGGGLTISFLFDYLLFILVTRL
ncbi:hypothetical protein ASPWEDRAFT_36545, partial [Aspergillus wentii DTO 134E9]